MYKIIEETGKDGTVSTYKAILHTDDDTPALIYGNGDTYWYKDGVLHRDDDNPAKRTHEGEFWYQHGLLHRDGGKPAVLLKDGTKQWYDHGVECTEEESLHPPRPRRVIPPIKRRKKVQQFIEVPPNAKRQIPPIRRRPVIVQQTRPPKPGIRRKRR